MASAITSQPTTPATCEERTEELVRKIKALSFSPSDSKTNGSPASPSACSPADSSSSKSHRPVRPATPPSVAYSYPPEIEIVYSAKVHPRSPSPPPKSLARTFPCPPEIPLPNETKLNSGFVRNTNNRVFGNSVDANSVVDVNKPLLTADAVPPQVDTNVAQPLDWRTRSHARRGRGNLWIPPKTTAPTRILTRPSTPLPQTRPIELDTDNNGWDTSSIEAKLSQISLSVFDEPTKSKHEHSGSIPAWLLSLPEEYEPAFPLDSVLNQSVSRANHRRLQDQFTTPAFNRFNDKLRNSSEMKPTRKV